jgi:predicted alpha/beta-hydrolase family hydrolase
MRHAFMEAVSSRLVAARVAVLRYQFPYVEAGGARRIRRECSPRPCAPRSPRPRRLHRAPALRGREVARRPDDLDRGFASAAPGVRGIAFFGFPLHAPANPGASAPITCAT